MSQNLEKTLNNWNINFHPNINSIIITITENNNEIIYQSSFSLKFIQTLKFFELKNSINEIINYISTLIDQRSIKINEIGGKLILKFNDSTNLILNKKEDLSEKNNEIKIENIIQINSINAHESWIRSVSIFPSGNIISVSNDQSIKIYVNNFNILQIISNAHEHIIYYVSVKDENNFVTCSLDESIKTWIKKKDNFILNQSIPKTHNNWVYK